MIVQHGLRIKDMGILKITILEDKIIDYFGEKIHSSMKKRHPKQCNTICLSIEYQKNKYEMAVGNQD